MCTSSSASPRVPALLSRSPPVRRQAEAGWGAVKRSCRWEPGLHPHSPRFRSRCEPWAPDPTYALGWSCGHRCKPGAGSHRAGKREWENFLREVRVGEGSGLSPSSPYLPLWGAGVATVLRWPSGHRQSLGGAVRPGLSASLSASNRHPGPLLAHQGLEPLRGGCHPRRPLPPAPRAAPETGINWFDFCTHRAPLTCTTGFRNTSSCVK